MSFILSHKNLWIWWFVGVVGFLPAKSLFSENSFFRIMMGYGLYGTGNIINGAGEGLRLIERGINSGFLFSPIWTPLIQQIGPIYQNQDFDLTQFSFELQWGKTHNRNEYGLSVGYFDLGFDLILPQTYLNVSRIYPESPFYLPVTKDLKDRTLLASVVQFDIFYHYTFFRVESFDFFFGGGVGLGFGKLSYSGPYVQEAHGILSLGTRYEVFRNHQLILMIKNLASTVKTGTSNLIDRRKVLVNPRRGEIIVSAAQVGLSFVLTE
ncbi:MAG: hypothetical protein RMI35_07375 [Leptospiraceae bacterium]|nr:hypothetical protein [Leptospiraceae bacterium]